MKNSNWTIGITGGIGSGKTTFCQVLEVLGFPVFYSDLEAKKLMMENEEVRFKVIELFGSEAYNKNGINRSFIANQIFSNPALKDKMNAIIHPAVRNHFANWKASQKSDLVFNEAAILFETGSYKQNDKNVLVIADESTRIKRIKIRDNASDEEIKKRMENQWKDEKKIPLADFVIHNNEDDLLLPQALELIQKLQDLRTSSLPSK